MTLIENNGLKKSMLLEKDMEIHNSDLESHAFETHLHRLKKKNNEIF